MRSKAGGKIQRWWGLRVRSSSIPTRDDGCKVGFVQKIFYSEHPESSESSSIKL
jgi:hypothetical protein